MTISPPTGKGGFYHTALCGSPYYERNYYKVSSSRMALEAAQALLAVNNNFVFSWNSEKP